MLFKETFVYDNRHPDMLSSALAKIGGLLAFLRFVTLFLREYHKRNFEKEQSAQMQIETSIGDTEQEQC